VKTKYTNSIMDLLEGSPASSTTFKLWGGLTPVSMGDGVRFRVTRSPVVDYVYIRYLSGYALFEIEFGALVGTDYDVLDRIKPISADDLMATISRKLFFNVLPNHKEDTSIDKCGVGVV